MQAGCQSVETSTWRRFPVQGKNVMKMHSSAPYQVPCSVQEPGRYCLCSEGPGASILGDTNRGMTWTSRGHISLLCSALVGSHLDTMSSLGVVVKCLRKELTKMEQGQGGPQGSWGWSTWPEKRGHRSGAWSACGCWGTIQPLRMRLLRIWSRGLLSVAREQGKRWQ